MAYSDTHCPCGGHKQPETMLCTSCETHLSQRPEKRVLSDPTSTWEQRRGSAIRLIAMARNRPLLRTTSLANG
jgi:hypothetical protein